MIKRLRALWICRRGTALMEFALAAPVLILLAVGGSDFVIYLLLQQKLQNAAFNVADLAARDKTLSVSQLNSIFMSVQHVSKPFDFANNGRAIVTGISATSSNNPRVYWQRSGAGSYSAASRVGSVGQAAAIPESLSISANETIIAAEIFYAYEPLFGLVLQPRLIHRTAYFKPRLGSLHSLE